MEEGKPNTEEEHETCYVVLVIKYTERGVHLPIDGSVVENVAMNLHVLPSRVTVIINDYPVAQHLTLTDCGFVQGDV